MIDEILKFNEQFVAKELYKPYVTTKYPEKKIAIVSCMDTRLTGLLLAALGLKNGDVKLIKNAGGVVMSPFDSTIRSLLVGIYELDVREIMIVGHTDCGAQHLDSEEIIKKMLDRGISRDRINMMKYCGINFEQWLCGFNSLEKAVSESVQLVANHPLIPADVKVRGFVIDSVTGKLAEIL